MNHKEQLTREDVLKAKLIMDSVTNLDDADGETLENIIELLGMTEQLTRQLVMGADPSLIDFLLEEKRVLKADEIKRRMRCVKQDANAILSHLMDDKPLDGLTDWGANIHTHLDNITIACDLNDNESKTWKL